MKRRTALLLMSLPLLCAGIYFLPPVHERLAWRVDEQVLRVKYLLNPPEQAVFVPQKASALPPPAVHVTPGATLPPATATPTAVPGAPDLQAIPAPLQPSAQPEQTLPDPTLAPLPTRAALKGVKYEDQHGRWNYCAPANLAMALSFWGWNGDRDVVGPAIKPDPKDKNVMLYEMVDYVTQKTDLRAQVRLAGDLDLLKRFISSGFPVLVEKGTYLTDLSGVKSWMGHYQVVTGYDDTRLQFIAQDSFTGADFKVPYEAMIKGWRAFNYAYLVIYPAEKDAEVQQILGADASESSNHEHAARLASEEIYTQEDSLQKFFAWFNRGSSLVALQDFAGAAEAYDQAYTVYPSIPQNERPWRMVWYQTGPYFAYFYAGRYYDVINLADTTLNAMQSEKNLEETYYWRGMARASLGDTSGGVADLRTALQFHPGFAPALDQLNRLGANP
jgi:hypothetical protein